MNENKLAELRDASNKLCDFCEADECEKCIVTRLMDDAIAEYENENKMTRFYLCGIGYDENNCVTDDEWSFGDFDDYAKAYELFVRLQCREAASFFTGAKANVYQMLLQLEECEETDDESECVDIRNETWVNNPNFKSK